jgi:hypothetical protein
MVFDRCGARWRMKPDVPCQQEVQGNETTEKADESGCELLACGYANSFSDPTGIAGNFPHWEASYNGRRRSWRLVMCQSPVLWIDERRAAEFCDYLNAFREVGLPEPVVRRLALVALRIHARLRHDWGQVESLRPDIRPTAIARDCCTEPASPR